MNRKPNPQRPGGPSRNPFGSGKRGPMPGQTAGFWILLILLVFVAFQMMYVNRQSIHEITYSAFVEQVETGNIAALTRTGEFVSNSSASICMKPSSPALDTP